MTHTLALALDIRPRPPVGFPEGGALSSVGKALQVLNSFRGAGVLLGVSQIAERAEVSKSTAHRLLVVLVEYGFVEKRDGRYMLGRSIFELGNLTADTR